MGAPVRIAQRYRQTGTSVYADFGTKVSPMGGGFGIAVLYQVCRFFPFEARHPQSANPNNILHIAKIAAIFLTALIPSFPRRILDNA
jgi:hypothetical protein